MKLRPDQEQARAKVCADRSEITRLVNEGATVKSLIGRYRVPQWFMAGMLDSWGVERRGIAHANRKTEPAANQRQGSARVRREPRRRRRTQEEMKAAIDRVITERESVIERHLIKKHGVYRIALDYEVNPYQLSDLMDSWGVERVGKHRRSASAD